MYEVVSRFPITREAEEKKVKATVPVSKVDVGEQKHKQSMLKRYQRAWRTVASLTPQTTNHGFLVHDWLVEVSRGRYSCARVNRELKQLASLGPVSVEEWKQYVRDHSHGGNPTF